MKFCGWVTVLSLSYRTRPDTRGMATGTLLAGQGHHQPAFTRAELNSTLFGASFTLLPNPLRFAGTGGPSWLSLCRHRSQVGPSSYILYLGPSAMSAKPKSMCSSQVPRSAPGIQVYTSLPCSRPVGPSQASAMAWGPRPQCWCHSLSFPVPPAGVQGQAD